MTQTPRCRRLLLRLLLVALAMCMALLAALVGAELWIGGPQHLEGPAQLRFLYEADSETGFRTASDYQRVMLDGGRSIDVRLNHVGMRGPNYDDKRLGERRVLFLGDSMTFGLGLQEDETYPAQFARQASVAWTAEVSAGNAAAPSFGPRDFAPFVRRVRAAFAPDLIVASVYIGNDFFDNFAYDRAVIDGYAIDGWAARLARSSWRARLCLRYGVAWKIETWLLSHAPSLSLDTTRGHKSGAELAEIEGFPPSPHDFTFLDDTASNEDGPIARLVARMTQCLAEVHKAADGVPVVVLVLPTYAHVIPGRYATELAAAGRDTERFRAGTAQARLTAICQGLGLRCIDVTPVLAAQKEPESLFLPHNLHLAARGCEVIAAHLVTALH